MQEKKLVEEMRKAADKLDIAIEAGERGDWPRADPCIAEAKRELAWVLVAVERVNDIDRSAGE